jgi:stress-induced morphogen
MDLGGCGAMFRVFVAAPEFSGVPKVGQHKAITEALKDEIKSMHGITIETKAIRKDTGE